MAGTKSCKYFCLPIWFVCVMNCASLTLGQVECDGSDTGGEQCDVDYYCDTDYRCKKCAVCENFQPLNSCAKTLVECGVCLNGYEFLSLGKCAERPYDRYTVGVVLLLVTVGCTSAIVVVGATLYYIRKKKTKTYSCRNRYQPETGNVGNVATAPSAPEYPPAPPPYTSSYSPPPEFNSLYNGSTEPLLKTLSSAQECQMEQQQMANPYSQYVRLPPGSHRYNFDGTDESENLNGNVVGVDDDVGNDNIGDNADVINNNNNEPSPPSSRTVPADGAPFPPVPIDNGTDSLPLQNLCMSTQVQDCDMISIDTDPGVDGDSSEARAQSPAPAGHTDAGAGAGAQQVIVQFISNISPILNLQGNNTRR